MPQDVNYEKAMQMLNTQLQHMKQEIDEIDGMSLRGDKKKMAKRMHKIYDKVEWMIEKYSKTQEHSDFNTVCRELEALQPAFTLNYNEICYDKGLDILNATLSEMEKELAKIDKMGFSGPQETKAKQMHEIYDSISNWVDKFAHSHEHHDFEGAVDQIEKLKPEFQLNYTELTG